MKRRTLNGKGRHLSTAGAVRILEEHGVETPDGPVRLPPGRLSKATANRCLRQWGYDHGRVTRAPAAVRLQAEHGNALMRPNMEEVGFRFAVFPFEGMAGHQAGYTAWLLGRCLRDGTDPASVIEPDAAELLAARLRTPLQVERYLAMAFEEARRIGERVVAAAVVDATLSRQLDDLEPRPTRHGYDARSVERRRSPDIADGFRVKPADVRLFLQGQLDPARTRELTEQMLVAGLPV